METQKDKRRERNPKVEEGSWREDEEGGVLLVLSSNMVVCFWLAER